MQQPVTPGAPVWIEQIRICSYDVDFTHSATSASLCRYFLEAAWNHAEALGAGFGYLAAQNRFWVLSRLLLEARSYPKWGSTVTLRTWPRATQSLFAMRDFELVDQSSRRLVAGSSAWLVLDATSRRPQRLNKVLPGLEQLTTKPALDRDPEKISGIKGAPEVFSTAVRYTDIDVNRHVNSVRYVSWILDAYPLDFHRENQLQRMELNCLDETSQGDVLSLKTVQTGPAIYWHQLVKHTGGQVCRARLEWAGLAVNA